MSARSANEPSESITRKEWGLIFLLMAVQFTHMVDFVIIMPLGERLIRELDLTETQFGTIVSTYAWAAGVASLFASLVMDRFDRRVVLLTMYAGFTASTLFCGLADSYLLLLVSRTLAGVFGGVAAVAIMAVIGDVFPPKKRGRASGAVMSAFAVASIAGLPAGLGLADLFGRGAPFIALAVLSLGICIFGWFRLPAIRDHLNRPRTNRLAEFVEVARQPNHIRAFVFTFFLVLGTFTVASFIGPYLVSTNGWRERDLAVMYFFAGSGTLVSMNVIGRLADRLPRRPLFQVLATGAIVMALIVTNLPPGPLWQAALAMSLFMAFAAGRMVPAQTMLLGAARPEVRGSFLSLNTAIQHLSTGIAPTIAGLILTRDAEGKLQNFPIVGIVAAITAGISLILAVYVRPAPESEVRHTQTPEPTLQEMSIESEVSVV